MPSYGTLSILDTLAANRTLIAAYGEDNAYKAVQMLLDANNAIQQDMLGDFVEFTSDRLRRYGGAPTMSMDEMDEFGSPDVQKILPGVNIGVPLSLFAIGIGWTRKYAQTHTVAELVGQTQSAMNAHARRLRIQVNKAIFTPTNNTAYLDRLVDNLNLPVRAFLNADSTQIPPDPYGNTFTASTHTHYLGTASFVAANLTSLITTVLEHYNQGAIRVYINQAQEAAVRAFSGFQAYVDLRIKQATTTTYADGIGLDVMTQYDHPIGIFGAAEIVVKPWVPTNYVFCYNTGVRKPLAFRTRTGQYAGLQIAADLEEYPLYAKYMEDEYGVAVQERANGACLLTNNATYSAPAATALG